MKARIAMSLSLLLALGAASSAAAQPAVHVLKSLSFEVKGITSERALRTFLSINPALREGMEFESPEELTLIVERKRQDLMNGRVFKSVEVEDREGEPMENGKIPHDVAFRVVDAFSLFPLPYPSYDSNSGFQLGVETRYDNGLGTMTNWYLDTYLVLRTRADVFGVGAWRIHPRISNLVLAGLPFTLDMQFDRMENSRIDQGLQVADWACYRAWADFNTVFNLKDNWYYKPELEAATSFGFEDFLPGGSVFNRDILSATLTNTVGVGRLDWKGNFRRGFDANAAVRASLLDRNDLFTLAAEANMTVAWYLPWAFLDYYGRVHAQYTFNDEPGTLGSWLRGVEDSSMGGAAGVFTNQTLAIDVIPWKGVLDLQIHPFVDAGIVAPSSRAFDLSSDLRVGVGADVVLFIDVISNFLIRCTVGMDVTSPSPLDHIEVMLNTSLFF